MKIDMRLLNPDRNKTENLWRRLESSPTLLVFATLCATNLLHDDMGAGAGWVILLLLMILSIVSEYTQRKIIRELKKRYEGSSEHTPEDSRRPADDSLRP